jgi:hypothetical protein
MTLSVLVIVTTIVAWLVILGVRWATVKPTTEDLSQRSIFVAAEFGGAVAGAVYPMVWILCSNLGAWMATGRAGFAFAGHLPPGVDEDDLLLVLVVGVLIFFARACGRFYSYLVEDLPAW